MNKKAISISATLEEIVGLNRPTGIRYNTIRQKEKSLEGEGDYHEKDDAGRYCRVYSQQHGHFPEK